MTPPHELPSGEKTMVNRRAEVMHAAPVVTSRAMSAGISTQRPLDETRTRRSRSIRVATDSPVRLAAVRSPRKSVATSSAVADFLQTTRPPAKGWPNNGKEKKQNCQRESHIQQQKAGRSAKGMGARRGNTAFVALRILHRTTFLCEQTYHALSLTLQCCQLAMSAADPSPPSRPSEP